MIHLGLALALIACSSTQITKVHKLSPSADAPYSNNIVNSLFEYYDDRVYLENEIVKELSERGVTDVATTSKITPKIPATRETFLAMVDELGSDAVLVTRLVN